MNRTPKWIEEVWRVTLAEALGTASDRPAAWRRPAVARLTITKPDITGRFQRPRLTPHYDDQVKPMNFVIVAYPTRFGRPLGVAPSTPFLLMQPFSRNARKRDRERWTDIHSGMTYRAADSPSRDTVTLKSYNDVVDDYQRHPEPKSASSDGTPCGRTTRGLLARRPVEVLTVTHIGKEANDLEDVEHGLVSALPEVLNRYDEGTDAWTRLVQPVLRAMPLAELAHRLHISERHAQRIRNGRSRVGPDARAALTRIAGDWARSAVGRDDFTDLQACADVPYVR